MRYITILIAYALLMTSCERVVKDFEVPEKPLKLVIHGRAEANTSCRINVSESLNFYDQNKFYPSENATLQLMLDGEELGYFFYDTLGWYSNPEVNYSRTGEYQLRVSAPDFEDASAIFRIPPEPRITGIEAFIYEEKNVDCYEFDCPSTYYLVANIRVGDDPSAENYYTLQVSYKTEDYMNIRSDPGGETPPSPEYAYYPLTMIAPPGLSIEASKSYDWYMKVTPQDNAYGELFFINDGQFTGENDSLFILADLGPIVYSGLAEIEGKYIVQVGFAEIDKQYYEYAKNRAAVQQAEGNPFAEPVTVYQSVEGGFGLIYGISATTDSIDLLQLEGPDLSEVEMPDYYY